MTKRSLPAVEIGARPGVRSDVSQAALSRWSPDVRAAAEDDATISILDVIGEDFWGEGVTARRINAALRQIGSRPVTVVINSPGGDVFEGLAIYNLLREHPERVTVKVVGLAASAASFIAMSGDDIQIARSAFMMVHNAWVVAMGDKAALREVAEWLEPFDAAMVDIYAARSGMEVAEVTGLLDRETWINGSQAVDRGLADGFLPRDEVAVDPRDDDAQARRAERAFDIIAARAGVSRRASRELMSSLRQGGKPGAAPTGTPGAADIAAEINSICDMLKS